MLGSIHSTSRNASLEVVQASFQLVIYFKVNLLLDLYGWYHLWSRWFTSCRLNPYDLSRCWKNRASRYSRGADIKQYVDVSILVLDSQWDNSLKNYYHGEYYHCYDDVTIGQISFVEWTSYISISNYTSNLISSNQPFSFLTSPWTGAEANLAKSSLKPSSTVFKRTRSVLMEVIIGTAGTRNPAAISISKFQAFSIQCLFVAQIVELKSKRWTAKAVQ